MNNLEPAIRELRGIIADASTRLAGFSDAQASVPLRPDHWSRKQILGHLLDSASNNHHRFVRAQIEDQLSMPGYAQEGWVDTQRHQDRPWNELVGFWTLYNRHLLHLMETVPPPQLLKPCVIGEHGANPVTLEFLMVDYVTHLQHHLDQILGAATRP